MTKLGSKPLAWDVLVSLLVALCCVAGVAFHVRNQPRLSPLDEFQQADYVLEVAEGNVPRQGDRVGEEAQQILACRGLDLDVQLPECGSDDPVDVYPEAGYNTSLGHSPLYFWVTAATRNLFSFFDHSDGLTAMRATGALWLAGGAVLLYAALRAMTAGRAQAALLALAASLAPGTLYAASTTNNDVGLYAAGCAFLLLAVLWLRREHQPAPWRDPIVYGFAVVAALATLIKASAYLGVLFVAVALLLPLLRGLLARVPGWLRAASDAMPDAATIRSALAVAGAGLLACVVAAIGWKWIMTARQVMPIDEIPMFRRYHVDGLEARFFFEQYFAVLPPLRPTYISPSIATAGLDLAIGLASALQLAVILLPLMGLRGRVEGRYRDVLVSVALVLAVSGPTLVLLNYLALANYQGVPSRYGLALVAPLMGAVVVASRARLFRIASSAILVAPAAIYVGAVVF